MKKRSRGHFTTSVRRIDLKKKKQQQPEVLRFLLCTIIIDQNTRISI